MDFSSLVLKPCMDVFGIEITVDPLSSRPSDMPYKARGIFSSVPMDVMGQDGSVMSDQRTTIGIRLEEFSGKHPRPRDQVWVNENRFLIDDIHFDGQGGATLSLRKVDPDYPI